MKIIFLLVFFFTLISVAYPRHKKRHRNEGETLWRRHYISVRKHNIKGQNPEKPKKEGYDPDRDINVTRIYDHVSKYHNGALKTQHASKRSPSYVASQPGVWQFNTIGGDEVKLLVSDISKKTADIVKGVRRSDCISGTGTGCTRDMIGGQDGGQDGRQMRPHHRRFSHEVFMPGDEKTFPEPMSFLRHHDSGPFHHFENHGHPILGGLARGASVVTHQLNVESPPSNVYMHGIEKTQP